MRTGIHFHGKLEKINTTGPFNTLLIRVAVDKKTIDLLDKLEMLTEYGGVHALKPEIEVTIAND